MPTINMDTKRPTLKFVLILSSLFVLARGQGTLAGLENHGTYDISDAWKQLNTYSALERAGESQTEKPPTSTYYASSRASKKSVDVYDTYASASSYGGGGGGYGGGGHGGGGYGHGGGGYGHGGGHNGGYSLNKSAVALLGFLYLLNLIQDIIQQTSTASTGRKRRDPVSVVEELMSKAGVGNGAQVIAYDLAATILPLMADFAEINDAKETEINCIEYKICSANQLLVSKYGQIGRVMAQLTTDSLLDHFDFGTSDKRFQFSQAAKYGRNQDDCYSHYSTCKL